MRFALLLAATAFVVILSEVVEAKANNDAAPSHLSRRLLTQDRHGKKGKKGKGKSAEKWSSNESGACDCSSSTSGTSGTSGTPSGTPIRQQAWGRKGKKGEKGKKGKKGKGSKECTCDDQVIGIGVITAAPTPTRIMAPGFPGISWWWW